MSDNQPFAPKNAQTFDKDSDDITVYANAFRDTMINVFEDRVGALFFMPHQPIKVLPDEKKIVNMYRPYVAEGNETDSVFKNKGTTLLAYVVHTDTENVLVRNGQTPNPSEETIPFWLCTHQGTPIEVGTQI